MNSNQSMLAWGPSSRFIARRPLLLLGTLASAISLFKFVKDAFSLNLLGFIKNVFDTYEKEVLEPIVDLFSLLGFSLSAAAANAILLYLVAGAVVSRIVLVEVEGNLRHPHLRQHHGIWTLRRRWVLQMLRAIIAWPTFAPKLVKQPVLYILYGAHSHSPVHYASYADYREQYDRLAKNNMGHKIHIQANAHTLFLLQTAIVLVAIASLIVLNYDPDPRNSSAPASAMHG